MNTSYNKHFFKLFIYSLLFYSSNLALNNLIITKRGDSHRYLELIKLEGINIFPEPTWLFLRQIYLNFGENFLLFILTFLLTTTIYLCIRKFDKSLITAFFLSIFLICGDPLTSLYSSLFSTWRAIPGWFCYFIYLTFFLDSKSSFKSIYKIEGSIIPKILELLFLLISLLSHPTTFFFTITTIIFYYEDSPISKIFNKFITNFKIFLPKLKIVLSIFSFIFLLLAITIVDPILNAKLFHYISYDEVSQFSSFRAILINIIISFFCIKYNNYSRVILGSSLFSIPIAFLIPAISYRLATTIYWISLISLISTLLKISFSKKRISY